MSVIWCDLWSVNEPEIEEVLGNVVRDTGPDKPVEVKHNIDYGLIEQLGLPNVYIDLGFTLGVCAMPYNPTSGDVFQIVVFANLDGDGCWELFNVDAEDLFSSLESTLNEILNHMDSV